MLLITASSCLPMPHTHTTQTSTLVSEAVAICTSVIYSFSPTTEAMTDFQVQLVAKQDVHPDILMMETAGDDKACYGHIDSSISRFC